MSEDWMNQFGGALHSHGLSKGEQFFKRFFDITVAFLGVVLVWWIVVVAWILATVDTQKNGLFIQVRVGRNGKSFKLFKIRTMRDMSGVNTTVTTSNDPRITKIGRFLRKTKIDEFPQFINVLFGQMSFVGPRPDVPGFADCLTGQDKIILSVRPGIIGPGTLKYLHEEKELAKHPDPERHNREVIFPDKVRLNRLYVENYSFWNDMKYLYQTFVKLRYHQR